VRIYFDRKRVAHAASTRAKARIAWRRAKPGLHHIRAVATHVSGAKLERHLWLLRRNDRIIRLIRRTK
jgi:hypothetical protein